MIRSLLILLLAGCTGEPEDTDCGPQTLRVTDWHDNDTTAGVDLLGVAVEGGNGYAVGANGTIVRTTGGGEVWSAVTSGVTTRLNAVATSASAAIAVGDGGVALALSGDVATPITTGSTADLRAIYVDGTDVLVAGDGVVLSGPAAGPWTSASTPSLYGITRVEGVTWAVGDGGALLRDGLAVDSGTTADLRAIAFASGTTGVAVGLGGAVIATSDGTNWTAQPALTEDLLGVVFTKGTYWATGSDGELLKSIEVENGSRWTAAYTASRPMAAIDTFEDGTMPNTQIIAVGKDGIAAVYGTREIEIDTGGEWIPCE